MKPVGSQYCLLWCGEHAAQHNGDINDGPSASGASFGAWVGAGQAGGEQDRGGEQWPQGAGGTGGGPCRRILNPMLGFDA